MSQGRHYPEEFTNAKTGKRDLMCVCGNYPLPCPHEEPGIVSPNSNRVTQPTRTREIAIAEWCGYTEIIYYRGLAHGRRPDGRTTEVPHYFTSRFAILDAMTTVQARGLSNQLRNYVRGVVWTDGSGRDVDNPTDGQRAEALARMVAGGLDGRKG